MADRHSHVKPASVPQPSPATAGGASPDAYTRWRATKLGRVDVKHAHGRLPRGAVAALILFDERAASAVKRPLTTAGRISAIMMLTDEPFMPRQRHAIE